MINLIYLISVYSSTYDLIEQSSTQEQQNTNLTNENSNTQLIRGDFGAQPYRQEYSDSDEYETVHNCFVTCCSFSCRIFYSLLLVITILGGFFLCSSGFIFGNPLYATIGGIVFGAGILYTVIMLALYKYCGAKSEIYYGVPLYV